MNSTEDTLPLMRFVKYNSQQVDKGKLMNVLTIAWAIWFCKNKRVLDNASLDVNFDSVGFIRMVHDYKLHTSKVFKPLGCPAAVSKWVRPPQGVVKINADAHIGDGTSGGLGVVTRDWNGTMLWVAVKRTVMNLNIEVPETAAVRYGCQLALRLGIDRYGSK
ncbi:uncharacterized protein LOC110717566 [Chenopodium quinoa]|uniref:uncharacterized protein LOC110717566 n=1 Tax=Chenopodium quinoa TaxID=63459 RepID=UPI000B7742FB|nr:uncharacterized protein LOC110717566 [Chenopodium quinoa]